MPSLDIIAIEKVGIGEKAKIRLIYAPKSRIWLKEIQISKEDLKDPKRLKEIVANKEGVKPKEVEITEPVMLAIERERRAKHGR